MLRSPVGQSCFLLSEEVLNLLYVPSLSSDSCFVSVSVLSLDFLCEVGKLQVFHLNLSMSKGNSSPASSILWHHLLYVVCLIINIVLLNRVLCMGAWLNGQIANICFAPKFQLFWKFLICLEGQGNIITTSVIAGKKELRDDCFRKPCALWWNCTGCL